MALVKCPDCGREVSDIAAACPQCGRPIPKPIEYGGPGPKPPAKTSIVRILLVSGIAAAVLIGLKVWESRDRDAAGPWIRIVVAAVPLMMLIGAVALAIWVIRRGTSQGIQDAREKRPPG